MRLRLFLLAMLAATCVAAPHAIASGRDQAPANPQWVDASFDLVQPTLTHVDLSGDLLAHKYRVNGATQTATQMAQSYQGVADFGGGVGDAFAAKLESSISSALAASLQKAFPDGTVAVTSVEVDKASLLAARQDDYTPPIRAAVAATVDRSRASAGLGALSDDAIEAAFSAGATVESAVALACDPGYATTYTIHAPLAPAGLSYDVRTGGDRASDGKSVVVTIENLAGTTVASQPTLLVLHDPSAAAPTDEDVRNVVDIRLGAVKENVTTIPVAVDVEGELRAVDVAARFPASLPSSVHLAYVSADGLRALHRAGAIPDAQVQAADDALLAEAQVGLSKAFGATVPVTGGLSRADLDAEPAKPFGAEPPVRFLAHANATYPIPGAHAKDMDLALDVGATLKFNVSLYSSTRPSTFAIHPPPGTAFTQARGGVLSADGLTATFEVPAQAPAPIAGLSMKKLGLADVTKENASLNVLIDIKDVDVTLGDASHGDFGRLVVDVTATGTLQDLGISRLPEDVRSKVENPNFDLAFLTSDAMREAIARGLVPSSDLASVETKLLDETRAGLASSMGGPVTVTGGFDDATLQRDAAAPGSPIHFTARASFSKPLSGGAPTDRGDASAVALKTIVQSFQLKRPVRAMFYVPLASRRRARRRRRVPRPTDAPSSCSLRRATQRARTWRSPSRPRS